MDRSPKTVSADVEGMVPLGGERVNPIFRELPWNELLGRRDHGDRTAGKESNEPPPAFNMARQKICFL